MNDDLLHVQEEQTKHFCGLFTLKQWNCSEFDVDDNNNNNNHLEMECIIFGWTHPPALNSDYTCKYRWERSSKPI